ncbi:hypothetical protein D3C77_750880 [compost metagenome]
MPVVAIAALSVMLIWLLVLALEPTWKTISSALPSSSFLPLSSVLAAIRLISSSIDWNSLSSAKRSSGLLESLRD